MKTVAMMASTSFLGSENIGAAKHLTVKRDAIVVRQLKEYEKVLIT